MFKFFFSMFLMLLINSAEATVLDKWSDSAIERLLFQAQRFENQGDKVDFISERFLNTRYKPNTLIGSETIPEQLTIRLDAVDCLTYLEYVEAMRRSETIAALQENLKAVRYRNGRVDYHQRKHFFSNWLDNSAAFIADVTVKVGAEAGLKVKKRLNESNSRQLVPGIPSLEKLVYYIPSYKIDAEILGRLKNGDYIGIYTDRDGLDVNHVGIVIKKPSEIYFRHADADAPNRKVVDTDFPSFFKHQRGIVVFRPL